MCSSVLYQLPKPNGINDTIMSDEKNKKEVKKGEREKSIVEV